MAGSRGLWNERPRGWVRASGRVTSSHLILSSLQVKRRQGQCVQPGDLDALKVEHDENEQRKEPTTSEKVALAGAIAERLQGRQLANLVQHRSGNISGSKETGDTRDIAAAKAGLGSGKTLEAAPLHKGWIPNPTLSDFSSGWAVMAGFQIRASLRWRG